MNLINKRFGRLMVLRDTGERKWGSVVWICLCNCGNLTKVTTGCLQSKDTRSCGCLHRERMKSLGGNNYKHGRKPRRLYRVWTDMKVRCCNPNRKPYGRYGGRGIQIWNEWKNDFISFRDWALNSGYRDDLTIDRIDNGGDYYPENCQWLTRSENSRKGNKNAK